MKNINLKISILFSKGNFSGGKLLRLLTIIFTLAAFNFAVSAQDSQAEEKRTISADEKKTVENRADEKEDEENNSEVNKYRLLQSNSLLVESAYQQEKGELQHGFSFSRSNRRTWETVFSEEIPLGGAKHQLSIELPAQFVKNEHGARGAGDVKIGYGYMLFGSNASRVTVSPGFGVSLPTGSSSREMGRGAVGVSFQLPVSVMLGKRFASNTTFETVHTRRAKNDEGERANLTDFEVGQSFVWFAKPKLNFLLETVWERKQEVTGDGLKKSERELFISPGARWAFRYKKFLFVPGVGLPIGVGPSRGETGVFFSFAIEQSLGDERD